MVSIGDGRAAAPSARREAGTRMPAPLSILFCEPYDGGSHRSFRLGLERHSRHDIHSLTLPPRFWKWRMRAAAVHFADQAAAVADRPWDLVVATSLLNAADLRGLLPRPLDRTPLLLYMHENQLTYPLSPEEEFDFHFGFTNILSALAADHVVFNSDFHREAFLAALPDYLARMPDAIPRNIRTRLAARSSVLPVGLPREPLPAESFPAWRGGVCAPDVGPAWPRDGRRPVILWNHRWEFDKEPEVFARTLTALAGRGLEFGVVLLGEPRQNDDLPRRLAEDLGDRCLHVGWEDDAQAYASWLARADVVVSCAQQEYFGISIAEAVHAGAYPVLPRRQVYPSLYGRRCRGRHLYDDEAGLGSLLADVLEGRCGHVCSLQQDADAFCWPRLCGRYDDLFARIAGRECPGT
jgi:glycosyltransferase involved in cell wall biosynthesis